MLKEDEVFEGETKDLRIECPQCRIIQSIKIPQKIVEESSHILTLSIPVKYICDHAFQVFIDKQFQIRGYQSTDYEITELEIYETGSKPFEGIINYKASVIIKKTIDILLKSKEVGDILGGALFNQQGNILYFSLPEEIFLNIISQLEFQKQEERIKLKKLVFVLENKEKVFAEFLDADDYVLIVVLYFPAYVSLHEANTYIKKLYIDIMQLDAPTEIMKKEQLRMKQIESAKKKQIKVEKPAPQKEIEVIEEPPPSNYWIYARVSNVNSLVNSSKVFLGTLGIDIDKKNILNLEEIIEKGRDKPFEGKIYFSEKYVRLMEGLALTIKDAAVFLNQLNKMP